MFPFLEVTTRRACLSEFREATQILHFRQISKDMARLVDDKDNIKHFIETMSNYASRFANGRYEPTRMTTSTAPAVSTAQALITEPANVEALHNVGSSRTMTSQGVPPKEHKDLESSSTKEAASAILHEPKHRKQKDEPPVIGQLAPSDLFSAESAPNKQLQSPQLSGLRAPPPTPETLARNGHTNSGDVGDLIGPEVRKILAGNGRHVGLEGSKYASHRASPLAETSPGLETAIESASSKAFFSHDEPGLESGDVKERPASHVNAKHKTKETSVETFDKHGGTRSSPQGKWGVESATTEVVDPWHTPNSELLDNFDEPKLGHKTAAAFGDDPFTQPEAKATLSRPSQKENTSKTASNKTTAGSSNSRLFVEEMQAKIMAFQASRQSNPSAAIGQPGKTPSENKAIPSTQSLMPRPHVPSALSYSQAELLALRPKNPNKGIVKPNPVELTVAAQKSTVRVRPTSRDEGNLIDFGTAISPPHQWLPAGFKNEIGSGHKKAEMEAPKWSPEAGLSTTTVRAPLVLKSVTEKESLPLQNPNIHPRPTPSYQTPSLVASSTTNDRFGAGAKVPTPAAASGQREDMFLGKSWRKPEKRDSAGKCSRCPQKLSLLYLEIWH